MESSKLSLELRDIIFEIDKCLGNFSLKSVGRSGRCICSAKNFVVNGHLDEDPTEQFNTTSSF